MSKFYVIGKASPELLKKMHADPAADRGAVMKSMCDSLGVKAISYEWLRGRFDVLFCVEGDYESVLAMKVTVLNSGMMSDLMVHCLLYTSPSPRDATLSRMPSSA